MRRHNQLNAVERVGLWASVGLLAGLGMTACAQPERETDPDDRHVVLDRYPVRPLDTTVPSDVPSIVSPYPYPTSTYVAPRTTTEAPRPHHDPAPTTPGTRTPKPHHDPAPQPPKCAYSPNKPYDGNAGIVMSECVPGKKNGDKVPLYGDVSRSSIVGQARDGWDTTAYCYVESGPTGPEGDLARVEAVGVASRTPAYMDLAAFGWDRPNSAC